MGGACCKDALDYNPDGEQKPPQTEDQAKNDGGELRKACKESDVELMHTLLRRMPIKQINGGASKAEVDPEEVGNTALHYCVANNHLRGCKKLVLYGHGLNTPGAGRKTPLQVALEAGKRKVAHFLLTKGASLNTKDGSGVTPLMAAFLSADKSLVSWLLHWTPASDAPSAKKPPAATAHTPGEVSPAAAGGAPAIDFCIQTGAGLSYVAVAARYGWWDILKELLARVPVTQDSDPLPSLLNARSKDGETALGWVLKYAAAGALEGGEAEAAGLVALLTSKGASLAQPAFKESVPPLLLAAAAGFQGLFDTVLQAVGGDVQGKDGLGRTALHYAAAKGHASLVQQLLAAGLTATLPDAHRDTPLHLAALRGHDQAGKLLMDASKDGIVAAITTPNAAGKAVFHLALGGGVLPEAQKPALDMVSTLAAQSPASLKLAVQDKFVQDTPLLLAVSGHQHAVVKALIDNGADVNEANLKGQTPLARCLTVVTRATAALDAAILKILLDSGATVETGNPATHPLLALCKTDSVDFSELALTALSPKCAGGAPAWATLQDAEGRTALHLASLYNNSYVSRLIVEQDKGLLETPCPKGRTPLCYAAIGCAAQSMQVLLNRGAQVAVQDGEGSTPLGLCLSLDKPASLTCAALLLRAGAKPAVPTDQTAPTDLLGETLLHRAVRYGAADFIRLWHRCGGDIALPATTPITANAVPETIDAYVMINTPFDPNAPKAAGPTPGAPANAAEILDEYEAAVVDMEPEEEEEEESDGEEEACRVKKAEREAAEQRPVAEGIEEFFAGLPWLSEANRGMLRNDDEFGYDAYMGPGRQQVARWQNQGSAGWWDSWLKDVSTQKVKGQDWQLDVSSTDTATSSPVRGGPTAAPTEDGHVESKDGPLTYDDVLWDVLDQRRKARTEGPAGPVAEGMLTDKLGAGLLGETAEKPDLALSTPEFAMQKACTLLAEMYAKLKLEQSDPFYLPGPNLYQGDPKCMEVDVAPQSDGKLAALADSLHDRLAAYKPSAEPALQGAELRARTLQWWLKSLAPEEFPMKVGAWKKLGKLTGVAVRAARARKPTPPGVAIKPRKRTVWIGLPDLPVAPELEGTTPLIYAVRLGRVSCVRALLDCGLKGLDTRDLWGHTPLDYAMLLLAKDKRSADKQCVVDMLLAMRPVAAPPAHDSVNSLHPLALTVVMNDLPRVAWLVRKCSAAIDTPAYYGPDAPAYLEGALGPVVGDTESRMAPLHLACLGKRLEMVRLLLDLGASPNRHAFGYEGPIPYKLRENWLDSLMDCRVKAKATLEDTLELRKTALKTEKEKTAAFMKEKKSKKKSFLAELAAKGKKFGAAGAVAGAVMGLGTLLSNIKNLIVDVLGGPDPWVSPLHLASRFGQADTVVLLLSRGATLNGGAAATFARRSPLEEALKYARSNFNYDNSSALRHNWEAIRARAHDLPTYSKEALEKKAGAAMMALMDPTKIAVKAAIMAAKFVIDLVLASMRRPIAHYDQAMIAAHVLLRNFAPMKPSETQTSALVRDLQDNGTWAWVCPDITIQDKEWLAKTLSDVEALKKDKGMDYEKIGKTPSPKEHDKLVKKFKNKCEQKFQTNGTKTFMELYKKRSLAKGKELTAVLQRFAGVSQKLFLDFNKDQLVGKLALQCMYADQLKAIKAEVKKAPKAVWGEEFLGSGQPLTMPGFDLTNKEAFLGSAAQSLGGVDVRAGAAGGEEGVSRAVMLAGHPLATAGKEGGRGQASNSVPFTVPLTKDEIDKGVTNPLGNSSAAAAAERREEVADGGDGSEEKLQAKMDALIAKAEKQRAEMEAAGSGKTGANPDQMMAESIAQAKQLAKLMPKDMKLDMEDLEGQMESLLEDIEADIDGLLEQAEEFKEMVQSLMDMVGDAL